MITTIVMCVLLLIVVFAIGALGALVGAVAVMKTVQSEVLAIDERKHRAAHNRT